MHSQRLSMLSNQLIDKLRDPEYRTAFVVSQINIGIPFQLRALLKVRGKTQEWLAEKAGMLQPRISGLLSPGKTRPNIEKLRRLADAFDCGLAVRFVPFSELASWSENFDPESFNVPSFEDELSDLVQNAETESKLANLMMNTSECSNSTDRPAYRSIQETNLFCITDLRRQRVASESTTHKTMNVAYTLSDSTREWKGAINGR